MERIFSTSTSLSCSSSCLTFFMIFDFNLSLALPGMMKFLDNQFSISVSFLSNLFSNLILRAATLAALTACMSINPKQQLIKAQFIIEEIKLKDKFLAPTCKFPVRYKNSSKPITEIKAAKRFSHVLLGWRFEPRELKKWKGANIRDKFGRKIKGFSMYKPQIAQTPPKTVGELLWIICWLRYTRLKDINKYTKIKERCIFGEFIGHKSFKCGISELIILVDKISTRFTSIACLTCNFPASCHSLNSKKVPKGLDYLKNQQVS